MNQWGFNLRRLNLQVLDVIAGYGGYVLNEVVLCRKKEVANGVLRCVIVDSTRRGKSELHFM